MKKTYEIRRLGTVSIPKLDQFLNKFGITVDNPKKAYKDMCSYDDPEMDSRRAYGYFNHTTDLISLAIVDFYYDDNGEKIASISGFYVDPKFESDRDYLGKALYNAILSESIEVLDIDEIAVPIEFQLKDKIYVNGQLVTQVRVPVKMLPKRAVVTAISA